MIAVYILLLHFIADFVLQSREMGKQKSYSVKYLIAHLSILFAVILTGTIPVLGLKNAVLLTLINTIVHGIIDWNIWRAYKWSVIKRHPLPSLLNFQYWEDHYFYLTIGLDQFLHAATLLIILDYIK